MHPTLSSAIELTLTVLLVFTLVTCIVLERRLAALRKGQDGLKATFADLNAALSAAATSIRTLKSSAAEVADQLDSRLSKARALADELALITASGERIAERFDRGPTPRVAMPVAAGAVSNRLEGVRTMR